MYKDVAAKIRVSYNALSLSEKRIADTILNNHANLLLHSSITELAALCKTSEASIFRFCRKIGVSGYQELRRLMIDSGGNTKTFPDSDSNQAELEWIHQIASRVTATCTQSLENTQHLVDPQSISDAVSLMFDAQRIYFFGAGTSMLSSMQAKNHFLRITPKVNASLSLYMQLSEAKNLTKEDVAVVFSFSGASRAIVQIAQELNKNQVPIICITRYAQSPLSSLSTIRLISDTNSTGESHGSMSAAMAQLYFIDLLYYVYELRAKESSSANSDSIFQLQRDNII